MNGEGRMEALFAALVISIVFHVGFMFWAKPRVMAHITVEYGKTERRAPMKISKARESADTLKMMESVKDVEAEKKAPGKSLERESLAADARIEAPEVLERELPVARPVAEHDLPDAPAQLAPELFDTSPVKLDESLSPAVPVMKLEAPSRIRPASSPSGTAPMPSAAVPAALPASVPASFNVPAPVADLEIPAKRMQQRVQEAFEPIEEVLEKVDVKIVEKEKEAVRALVESADAKELAKYVNVAMTVQRQDQWTYFKVMMVPRTSLKTVPKDVVLVIDASGSIGKDRLNSVISAAKKLLRDATNSGDRFNLVAFRDRYDYAFRTWQECSRSSFEASDRWLNRLAPHGRTDVFATISSVLTLPRDPVRPVIALVITDGVANSGVRRNTEILSRFTALNDGLISVYMYGVKGTANRELIDVLTRSNRGDGYVFDGMLRWRAGSGIADFAEGFRDPVLTDLRIVFASGVQAESYPRLLKNIYRSGSLEFFGRVPSSTSEIAFSVKGLNAADAFESFFVFPVSSAAKDNTVVSSWEEHRSTALKLRKE